MKRSGFTKMLNENDWWIHHQQVESLCKKLYIIFAEKFMFGYLSSVGEKSLSHLALPATSRTKLEPMAGRKITMPDKLSQ
jgi:hypothetical protein